MASRRVGSDIGALCGKCGDVWHVVVAIVDGHIAQVECKQCGARHRYRPAAGEATARARMPARRAGGPSRPRSRREPPPVVADPSRPPRPFRPSETYRVGDRLVHATYGEGVVQAVTGATKIAVRFGDGTRTLVHARSPR